MDDPLLVRRFEASGNLNEQRDRLAERDGISGEALGQSLSLDELHHQKRLAVGFLKAVERGDVRVIQLGQEPGFSFESIEPLLVPGECLGKHFDRNVTTELRISRPVDLSPTTS